jgi:hypothetical protein
MLQLSKKKSEYYDASSLVKQKDLKAPPNHIGMVLDSFNLFGAGQMSLDEATAKDYLKEIYESLPFLGNKILKMEKANDTNWV